MEITINDIRMINEFKGITFSNFKKSDVKKELIKNLKEEKIEQACYWSAEMICAGQYSDLWDIIILFYAKYIHIGNPKISIYLDMRIETFKEIVRKGYILSELELRNNNKIRRLFSEVISILCLTKKRYCYDLTKIKDDDYDMKNMSEKMKATNLSYCNEIFQEDDPKELFIATNEMAYNLAEENQNLINGCYWMEWIIGYEKRASRNKEKIQCQRRPNNKIETIHEKDVIWLVWEIIEKEGKKRSKIIQKIVKSLKSIFCLKYRKGVIEKRKYLLYFVVTLLCENPKIKGEIITTNEKEIIKRVTEKIDEIYKQIKKGEITPATDYLFKDLKAKNLQSSINKIEQINSFEENFIPRISEK